MLGLPRVLAVLGALLLVAGIHLCSVSRESLGLNVWVTPHTERLEPGASTLYRYLYRVQRVEPASSYTWHRAVEEGPTPPSACEHLDLLLARLKARCTTRIYALNITAHKPHTVAVLVEHPDGALTAHKPRGQWITIPITISNKPYKIHILNLHNQTQNITITYATGTRSLEKPYLAAGTALAIMGTITLLLAVFHAIEEIRVQTIPKKPNRQM